MFYNEINPSPKLSKFIKCFWILWSDNFERKDPEIILPDGCPEIVFNLGSPFVRHFQDRTEVQPRTIIAGQITGHISIQPTRLVKLFGVRFHPAGLYPLLRSSLSELTDKVENIEAILGIRGKELEEKIFESGSDAERIAVFENMMNKIFEGPQIRGLTSVGLDMIIKNQGRIKVEDVARSLETNTKTLERHFNREIGINPKMFCRVERLQNVLQSIKKVPGMRWTEIAYSFGYVDQAHFIRDFRGFAGVSPSAFVKQQNTISDSFVG